VTREVEFFFDIGSSYSYLAATQMAAFSERTSTPVRWRPFLLGAVFKATSNDLPIRVPAKARWMMSDMQAWCDYYGIPLRLPSRFPLVTLRTQRFLAAVERTGAQHLPAAALSLFAAYWANDQDPTTDPALTAAANAAGLDAAALIAQTETQDVKDHLRATTDEAVKRGAFGAPTLFVGDVMFWGNDRLPLLERYLAK
jgi:2-hydroxychromene-2-carboxylate isomerase